MRKPKVTVLMSTYNNGKYLHEAIYSILNQTFEDFEFLIINDGSTDNTAKILQSTDDHRIKIITNEKNIGLTKSLNKGLKDSQGEYIARMDADDISVPERLEKEVNFLDKNSNVGLAGTYYLIINGENKVLSEVKPLADAKKLKKALLKGNRFGHGSVMFRKECINKVGRYREVFKLAQDYDLWLRIAESFDVENLPEFLYKWRLDINQISVVRKSEQDEYASLAVELAKERRKFGKDRFQISQESINEPKLDDSFINIKSNSRIYNSQGYACWAGLLLAEKNYTEFFKFLLKSFSCTPLNKKTWILILLFLFKPFNNRLKKVYRLHQENNYLIERGGKI